MRKCPGFNGNWFADQEGPADPALHSINKNGAEAVEIPLGIPDPEHALGEFLICATWAGDSYLSGRCRH